MDTLAGVYLFAALMLVGLAFNGAIAWAVSRVLASPRRELPKLPPGVRWDDPPADWLEEMAERARAFEAESRGTL